MAASFTYHHCVVSVFPSGTRLFVDPVPSLVRDFQDSFTAGIAPELRVDRQVPRWIISCLPLEEPWFHFQVARRRIISEA